MINYRCFYLLLGILFAFPASAKFVYLTVHPEASTVFPDALGIKEFTEFNNRLYMGYGRNGARTTAALCPPPDLYQSVFCRMKLRYLDPTNGTISSVQDDLRSQGMITLNVHNDNLYALAEDPGPFEMLIRCTPSSCAIGNFPTLSYHNLVSEEYQGSIYVGGGIAAGVDQYHGGIWKSTDDGLTWSLDQPIYKTNSIPCCARVAFLEVFNGSLYAQAIQYDDFGTHIANLVQQNVSYKLTGNTWTQVTNDFLEDDKVARSEIFNGKIAYRVNTVLKTYDGTTVEDIYSSSIRDFYIDDGYLYVLQGDGKVFQTKDLSHWQPVEEFASSAYQLAVYGDTMFLGDSAGNIWVSDKSFPRPPIAYLPAVYHLLED